jgi:Icc-related predicted phosphoesterase
MKILCVADHIDPLVYSSAVKSRFGSVDLVLSAGDLPMEYLGFISASLNKPVLFVFGNHNLTHLKRFRRWGLNTDAETDLVKNGSITNFFGSTYIGSRIVCRKGLLIGGLGGCRRYNRGENQFTEYQMLRRMLVMVPRLLWNWIVHGRCIDILLTHAPPRGINDRSDPTHQGFAVFHWFVNLFKPAYLLHGHVHLYDRNAMRESVLGSTRVINVYNHYLVEIDDGAIGLRRRWTLT